MAIVDDARLPAASVDRRAAIGAAVRAHSLDIDGVTHRYGGFVAVDDVTLAIAPGEIVALLGPSGCGKTTLLRIVAGFVAQTRGRVLVDGAAIDDLPPHRRDIGIVFQNYALFPHMSVAENVAYGLEARREKRADIRRKVVDILRLVRMDHLAERSPRQLSGGQQQRVALARALAVAPRILLLDEPFGALDKNLRLDMQFEVKRLQRQLGLTAIIVTHDQEEAMSLADRIAVMNRGRVEQLDTPIGVYDRPATLFVNGFVGSTNLLPGKVVDAHIGRTSVRLDAGAVVAVERTTYFTAGERVLLSVRPEQLRLFDAPRADRWEVAVRLSLPVGGSSVHDLVARDGTALKLAEPRNGAPVATTTAYCGLAAGARPALFAFTSKEP